MIEHTIYNTVESLPKDWDILAADDIFLQSNYLKALASVSPTNISWYYVAVFVEKDLVGIAIIQRIELYLEDIFRNFKDSCYRQKFKHLVSKLLKGNMLVVGNLMHTGQHGIHFNASRISQAEFLATIYIALQDFKNSVKKKHYKNIRIIMMKDFFTDDAIHLEHTFFESEKFRKVSVQPNMILKILDKWANMDAYLSDLTGKYRQRYKVARKKAFKIEKKELTVEDIQLHSERLFKLYKNVSDNAKINTFILPKGHFLALKHQLDENFKVFGYYSEGVLIGFYTLILNGKVLETYFLGYDFAHQYKNQLYLNMLYDMLEFGIKNQFKSIVYARTAMEIKSSIGAKPQKMIVYLKHTNTLMNTFLYRIFKLMDPKQDWEERHPFK